MSNINPEQFACLQGDCPLSCCCGWRIGLDETTEQRWQAVDRNLSEVWFAALDCRGDPEFQVCLLAQDEQGCCKLMDEDGLCGPHKAKGIDYKPETCRRFPQLDLPSGHYSLSLACPEVARLLLEGEFSAKDSDVSWQSLAQLQTFTNGLFVDWHEVDGQAAIKLWQLVATAIPQIVWQITAQPIKASVSGYSTELGKLCDYLDKIDRDILSRYFYQSSLHLGLPDKPYAGDAIASVTQLSVLLLALLVVLSFYRQQGVELTSAETGLIISHLERQWGHPSSGLELLRLHPWLAQLDWREPTLSILAENLDV